MEIALLCKLKIDIIESGNLNSNHLNSRKLHLKGKDFLQFTKNLKLFRNYDMRKSYYIGKKCNWNHAITIPEYFQTIFCTIIFINPWVVNSMDSFNANFKKQQKASLIK